MHLKQMEREGGLRMHYVIDDFVWVAIGIAVVAFLFVLGAAYIFLDEGVKRLIRSFHRPASLTIQNVASQPVKTRSAISTSAGKSGHILQGIKSQWVKSKRSTRLSLWRTFRSKVSGAKSGTLHFHIRHHNPAKAKS